MPAASAELRTFSPSWIPLSDDPGEGPRSTRPLEDDQMQFLDELLTRGESAGHNAAQHAAHHAAQHAAQHAALQARTSSPSSEAPGDPPRCRQAVTGRRAVAPVPPERPIAPHETAVDRREEILCTWVLPAGPAKLSDWETREPAWRIAAACNRTLGTLMIHPFAVAGPAGRMAARREVNDRLWHELAGVVAVLTGECRAPLSDGRAAMTSTEAADCVAQVLRLQLTHEIDRSLGAPGDRAMLSRNVALARAGLAAWTPAVLDGSSTTDDPQAAAQMLRIVIETLDQLL